VAMSTSACASVAGRAPGHHLASGATSTTWSVVPSPNVTENADNEMRSVSCVSSSFCIGVGVTEPDAIGSVLGPDPTGLALEDQPLTERFDGTSWAIIPSPSINGDLSSVACSTDMSCVAVGITGPLPGRPLIEEFDGNEWSVEADPSISLQGYEESELASVSCWAPGDCIAVGGLFHFGIGDLELARPLIELTQGSEWSGMALPAARANHELSSVSCLGPAVCDAVGNSVGFSPGDTDPFVMDLRGTKWSLLADSLGVDHLWGVSCLTQRFCLGVGDATSSTALTTATVEITPRGVQQIATPKGELISSTLYGVSCTRPSTCWAVGETNTPTGDHPIPQRALALEFNGQRWSGAQTVAEGHSRNFGLAGVSCLSGVHCVSAGDQSTEGPLAPPNHTLVVELSRSPSSRT
jgi:hypothetical protein